MKLKDKTAFITGADSGIGQAIAIAFAVEGARICIGYHSDRAGAKETASLISKIGTKSMIVKLDVSKEHQVEKALDKAASLFGTVDILVNNAAVNGSNIPLSQMPTELFDGTIKTNVYSMFFACRWFAKRVSDNDRGGRIINISSIHEDIATAGNIDYNTSKGAVRMFTRTLALELARYGVTVNNIAPGMILTSMNQQAMENTSVRDEKSSHIPLNRPGKPEEIAKLAVFLASNDGDYVTGSTYVMDGGLKINLGQGA
ncbi:MAG: glucose 1-dehydrogenase [Chitinophagaceae bacterium]|nr:MAG: glucose 1-dehydrogenase [Chitinophagaceae bacterium]